MANPGSIKKNFAYNAINTVSSLLFPLITFPYVSRILLADGLGEVYFLNSIVGYITLLTSLGIPLYAIRETARVRDDMTLLSKTAIEILSLHLLLTFAGYFIVFLLACTVARIQADVPLFLLLSASIMLSTIGVNWFYSGIEDFRYITVRSVLMKTLSVIGLFIFVKEKGDLYCYAVLLIMESAGNSVFNFFRLRRHITFVRLSRLEISRHIAPAVKIFALNLIVSLYLNLDSVMLGFMKDDDAVGYYTASTRLSKILIGVVSSLGTALLPRLSHLAGKKRMKEFTALSDKCINFTIALSLPLSVGIIFMASPVIHLFSGSHFEPSILTLQIMAPTIVLIPLSGIYGIQILYALGHEKRSIVSVSAGALVNFTLNLCFIPAYAQYGCGFSTLIAEFCVTLAVILLGGKYVPPRLFSAEKMHYYAGSLCIMLTLLLLKVFALGEMTYLIVGTALSVAVYFICLTAAKDRLLAEIKTIVRNKISNL
jgi:O-antigen/teichoic acid export membrane protein